MKIDIFKILVIILLVLISLGLIVSIKNTKSLQNNLNFDKTIDSLSLIIKESYKTINKQNLVLDSLYSTKQTKIYYNETIIKDFNNPLIISDDSITSYISNKISSRK